jgi:hypothetical protein
MSANALCDRWHCSPLHFAARVETKEYKSGHLDVCRVLIGSKADVDSKDNAYAVLCVYISKTKHHSAGSGTNDPSIWLLGWATLTYAAC